MQGNSPAHAGRYVMESLRPLALAISIAYSQPASAWRITPVAGSLHSTRSMRFAAASVPSQTITTPACCE